MTLQYSGCDSLHEGAESLAGGQQQSADSCAGGCQTAGPLSAGTCSCSASLISSSDPALCTAPSAISMQVGVQFETSSADDAVTGSVSVESHDAMYCLISDRLQSVEDISERQRLCASLEVLLEFFDAEYLLADTSCSGFPLHLLEQYTKLIKDDIGFYSADG